MTAGVGRAAAIALGERFPFQSVRALAAKIEHDICRGTECIWVIERSGRAQGKDLTQSAADSVLGGTLVESRCGAVV